MCCPITPVGGPGCSGGAVAQLTRGPPAECLQVDMRTRSSFELKAPSSLHGLAEKVLLARKNCSPVRPRPTHLPACPLPAAYVDLCVFVCCRLLARTELRARRHVEHGRIPAPSRTSSTAFDRHSPCSRGRNKAKRGSCLAKHHPRLPSAPLGVAARFAVGLGQGTAVERKCEQIEWRLACRRLLVACPVRSELHAPNRALPDDPMTVSDDPMTVF